MKNRSTILFIVILFCFLFNGANSFGQIASNISYDDMFKLELKDLMNLSIVPETGTGVVGDASSDSYVITKEEIMSSGATTIIDALRMTPFLIVKEQGKGAFTLEIMEESDRESVNIQDNKILFMINDYSILNWKKCDFWRQLTVDLPRIEKIEVMRGESVAAAYGDTGKLGVVNIKIIR